MCSTGPYAAVDAFLFGQPEDVGYTLNQSAGSGDDFLQSIFELVLPVRIFNRQFWQFDDFDDLLWRTATDIERCLPGGELLRCNILGISFA